LVSPVFRSFDHRLAFSVFPRPYLSLSFFFIDTTTSALYTLPLHDALPICVEPDPRGVPSLPPQVPRTPRSIQVQGARRRVHVLRSEEHTSELQSRFDLVCRLLLEKKKEYVWWN